MENQIFRQDGGQLLNSWFVGIMWIKIVFSVLGIIGQVWHMFSDITSANPIVVISVVLAVCAVTGGYWLLGAEKKGFYMIVGANIALAILSYYQYTQISADECGMLYNMAKQEAFRGVWGNICNIIILMLLMLLRKNGKNAYEIIWTR